MATMFVIDLERRICIARGSNVDVLAKFADRKSGSSYTGNLNDVIGALKVDELTDLYNNHCGDLDLPPREKKFAKKVDAKKALKNVLASANIAEPKNGGRKKTSKKKQSKRGRKRATNGKSKMDQCVMILEKHWKDYCDGNVRRKDILKEFQSRAGMTKAGASTYMEILKKRFIEDEY